MQDPENHDFFGWLILAILRSHKSQRKLCLPWAPRRAKKWAAVLAARFHVHPFFVDASAENGGDMIITRRGKRR